MRRLRFTRNFSVHHYRPSRLRHRNVLEISQLPIEIPKTTRFLVVWYLSETLITPLLIALGFVVFPCNTRYNDIANVVACGIWTAIALAGLRLTRPNMGKVETPLPQGPTKRISEIAALVELLTRSHQ